MLLDTGCTSLVVKDALIPKSVKRGRRVIFSVMERLYPEVRCLIESAFSSRWVNAIAVPIELLMWAVLFQEVNVRLVMHMRVRYGHQTTHKTTKLKRGEECKLVVPQISLGDMNMNIIASYNNTNVNVKLLNLRK